MKLPNEIKASDQTSLAENEVFSKLRQIGLSESRLPAWMVQERDHASEMPTAHLTQIHGTEVICADTWNPTLSMQGDGLFRKHSLQKMAIQTADCLPVILWDLESPFTMVLHAGWRGLASGIIENGIQILKESAKTNHVVVCLGPCIQQKSFEVGQEVIDSFCQNQLLGKNEPSAYSIPNPSETGKYFLDLQQAARMILEQLGISPQNIVTHSSCTFLNEDFPSYRRMKGKETKRLLTIV